MPTLYRMLNCTYPLHVRKDRRPITTCKKEGAHICKVCAIIQEERYKKACGEGFLNQVGYPSGLIVRFGTERGATQYANQHAPDNSRWCPWGLHYAELVDFEGKNQHCIFCTPHSRESFQRFKLTEIRKKKTELAKEIKTLRKQVEALYKIRQDIFSEISMLKGLLDEYEIAAFESSIERIELLEQRYGIAAYEAIEI